MFWCVPKRQHLLNQQGGLSCLDSLRLQPFLLLLQPFFLLLIQLLLLCDSRHVQARNDYAIHAQVCRGLQDNRRAGLLHRLLLLAVRHGFPKLAAAVTPAPAAATAAAVCTQPGLLGRLRLALAHLLAAVYVEGRLVACLQAVLRTCCWPGACWQADLAPGGGAAASGGGGGGGGAAVPPSTRHSLAGLSAGLLGFQAPSASGSLVAKAAASRPLLGRPAFLPLAASLLHERCRSCAVRGLGQAGRQLDGNGQLLGRAGFHAAGEPG